jgi:dTDP-glucose pyrophosphorylase
MKKNLKINYNLSIKKTFKKLNTTGEGCLFVINDKDKFVGSITDGDCRRALLNGKNLNSPIKKIFNKNPLKIYKENFNKKLLKNIFLKNQVDVIPILNNQNKVINYVKLSDVLIKKIIQKKHQKKNNSIIIMAGGEGRRMLPFTSILPKPLLPLKNQTVIEKIISNFLEKKFYNFWLSVNYKSKIIKSFFEELKPNYNLKFIEEKIPMGTIGSLSLLKNKVTTDFFVCNCDTICNPDFDEIIKFHKQNRNILTIVASSRKIAIPYGVCELDKKGHFLKINEKPNKRFMINTGLYLFNKKIFKYIPKKRIDIDQLIKKLKFSGEKIGVFPSLEKDWFDVGVWKNYNQYKNSL